jgi:hypothetical protein
LGKRRYLPGAKFARTLEDKITASLREVRFCFVGAAGGLALVAIGIVNLAVSSVSSDEDQVLVFIQIGLGILLSISCVACFGPVRPWPRVHMITDRHIPWHAASNLMMIFAAAAAFFIHALPLVFALPQAFSSEQTIEDFVSYSATAFLTGGAFVTLSRIAAGLEVLAWIKDILREQGVIEVSVGQRLAKQTEQEPQLPNLAQTS